MSYFVHTIWISVQRMTTKAKGLRLQSALEADIAREAETRGKSWSAMANELLAEAIRLRRVPGIVFVDGPSGRRAALASTGLDVWEVISVWQELNDAKSYGELRANFDWLSEAQLRTAVAYYKLYPSEIDARLAREREWTPEKVRKELPFAVRERLRR